MKFEDASVSSVFSVVCNSFGGYSKTSSGLMTLRAVYLDARYVRLFR